MSHLLSHNVLPRESPLEAVYRIFEYVYHHKKGGCVVFDNVEPDVVKENFKPVNLKSIYEDITEDIPSNMHAPRGNLVTISMFCDDAFARDLVTRRSQYCILICINGAIIMWYSK